VLFTFDVLYLELDKLGLRFSRISAKAAILWAVPLAIITSMAVGSLAGFRIWTLTPVLVFENERVLVYLMSFVIGIICQRQGVLQEKTAGKLCYNIANGVACLPVTGHIFVRIWPFFYPAGFAVTESIPISGHSRAVQPAMTTCAPGCHQGEGLAALGCCLCWRLGRNADVQGSARE